MFIPLLKVDEAQRLVYGSFDETPDRAKEICDYATAKDAFREWSDAMHKASGGKSFGNVRGQHNPKIAAGLLKSIEYDDEAKRIDFCAHIVDDQEWRKVEAGVYTGFSPGGRYAKRWADGKFHRYTPEVGELSIVDVPCNPAAGFMLVKADGSEEQRDFVIAKAYEPGNDATKARALEMAKAENPDADEAELKNLQKNYVGKARSDLIAEKADEELAELAKADSADPDEDDGADEGGDDNAMTKTDGGDAAPDRANALEAALEKAEAKAKGKYGDVEYADAKNKKYPVDTAKHIRAAWSYINMPKNQKGYSAAEVKSIKDKIVSAWKDKIDKDGPPEAAEKMFELVGSLAKLAPAVAVIEAAADKQLPLRKGMYQVQRLASLIDCVSDLQCSVKWESECEGDDSTVPEEVANAVANLGTILIHMVSEEVQEIVDGYRISGMDVDFDPDGDDDVLEMAAKIVDLAKANHEVLEKAGARNSAKDASTIQGIHDSACDLGASCPDASAEKVADLTAERDALAKSIDGALPRIEELSKTIEELKAARETDRAELDALKAQPVMGKGQAIVIDKSDDKGNGDLNKGDPEPGSIDAINAMPAGPERTKALESWAQQRHFESRR